MSETFKQKLLRLTTTTIGGETRHIGVERIEQILAAHEQEVAEVKRDLTDDKDVLN